MRQWGSVGHSYFVDAMVYEIRRRAAKHVSPDGLNFTGAYLKSVGIQNHVLRICPPKRIGSET